MSLHLNRQCQRAVQQKRRTTIAPRWCTGGRVSVSVGDRRRAGHFVGAPSVKRHIWRRPERVNPSLQFSCTERRGRRDRAACRIHPGSIEGSGKPDRGAIKGAPARPPPRRAPLVFIADPQPRPKPFTAAARRQTAVRAAGPGGRCGGAAGDRVAASERAAIGLRHRRGAVRAHPAVLAPRPARGRIRPASQLRVVLRPAALI